MGKRRGERRKKLKDGARGIYEGKGGGRGGASGILGASGPRPSQNDLMDFLAL
jgi:hypothetical protein